MKRKAFIKILMSAGVSRNDANLYAMLAQASGRPYLQVSGALLCFHRQDFNKPLTFFKILYTICKGHDRAAIAAWDRIPQGGAGQ